MNHQRLKCYEVLLGLAKQMPALIAHWPRGNHYLEDQLKRALSSAILNLAEGNGRISVKERRRFFDISLASIAEVAAIIDIIASFRYISALERENYKCSLRRAYAMIIKLKRANLNLNFLFSSSESRSEFSS